MKPANAARVTWSADARTDIALEIPLVAEDHRLPRKFRDLFGAKGPVADDLVKRLAAEIAVEHQFALQPTRLCGHDGFVDRLQGREKPARGARQREAALAGRRGNIIMQVKQGHCS